jgi:hypothetical protein
MHSAMNRRDLPRKSPPCRGHGDLFVASRRGECRSSKMVALTGYRKRRLTARADTDGMFVQLHLQGLSRTALLVSAVGAVMFAVLGSAPGAV